MHVRKCLTLHAVAAMLSWGLNCFGVDFAPFSEALLMTAIMRRTIGHFALSRRDLRDVHPVRIATEIFRITLPLPPRNGWPLNL